MARLTVQVDIAPVSDDTVDVPQREYKTHHSTNKDMPILVSHEIV